MERHRRSDRHKKVQEPKKQKEQKNAKWPFIVSTAVAYAGSQQLGPLLAGPNIDSRYGIDQSARGVFIATLISFIIIFAIVSLVLYVIRQLFTR